MSEMSLKMAEWFPKLPELLLDRSRWGSLIINRRKPYTYRMFTQLPDGYRVCLHRFDECNASEAFFHPHPWPGIFMILSGSYIMKLALASSRTSKAVQVSTQVLTTNSIYEISDPLVFHSIAPIGPTFTVMLNGEPWPAEIAHEEVRTTKGKDLEQLSELDLDRATKMFSSMISCVKYNNHLSALNGTA